ncbi:glycosyl transferase family 1 [Halobacteriales archaeon SW_7_68_16]|nr:MAG: glycosyl transferase family 1 [Halobacteriales archaeon SW_7_68_16]
MRVAYVALRTVRHRSTPATRRLQRVAASVSAAGDEVAVFCPRWAESGDAPEIDGVDHRPVAPDPDSRVRFRARLPLAVRRFDPDVVHALAAPPRAVRAADGAATLARVPLVAEWFDPVTEPDPGVFSRPARSIAPSELVATRLRERGADPVTTIPEAIRFDRLTDVDSDDRGDVVSARRLDDDANLDSLLLALAEVRDRDWSAVVIGDGPEADAYRERATELRIDDRVTFVDDADREERLGIYRGAHAFVQTARRCVFARELLWALAAGCVGIVAYHAGSSAHELVAGREHGAAVTTDVELVDAIRSAADHDRRTIDESFRSYDVAAIADRYRETYRELRNG